MTHLSRNAGCSYRDRIGAADEGQTALDYLCATRPHSTRQVWSARFHEVQIELDGRPAGADVILRSGQTLIWHRPPWHEPEVPLHFDVLYEDEALLAVNKPAGLPTMAAGGYLTHTLLALVRARFPDARPLHRLGRHTSGLVLFAQTSDAASALAADWRNQRVRKHYRALAQGVATRECYEIDAPIGPVPHPTLGSVHAASALGRPSRSRAIVLERRQTSTLFAVEIATGRPHQIRIHLAHAGHPLVGDPLYDCGGLPRADDPGLPGDGGYLLHAERLAFTHPLTRIETELCAPPPAALCSAFVAERPDLRDD